MRAEALTHFERCELYFPPNSESSSPIPASRMQNINDLLLMSTPGPRTELLCDPAAEPWPLQQLTSYLHPTVQLASSGSMPPLSSYDPNIPLQHAQHLQQRHVVQRSVSRASNPSGSTATVLHRPSKLERMLSQDAAPPHGGGNPNLVIKTEAGDLVTATANSRKAASAASTDSSSNPLLKRMLVKSEPGK